MRKLLSLSVFIQDPSAILLVSVRLLIGQNPPINPEGGACKSVTDWWTWSRTWPNQLMRLRQTSSRWRLSSGLPRCDLHCFGWYCGSPGDFCQDVWPEEEEQLDSEQQQGRGGVQTGGSEEEGQRCCSGAPNPAFRWGAVLHLIKGFTTRLGLHEPKNTPGS